MPTRRIKVAYAAGGTVTVRTGAHEPMTLAVDDDQTVTVPTPDAERIAGALGGEVLPEPKKKKEQ